MHGKLAWLLTEVTSTSFNFIMFACLYLRKCKFIHRVLYVCRLSVLVQNKRVHLQRTMPGNGQTSHS